MSTTLKCRAFSDDERERIWWGGAGKDPDAAVRIVEEVEEMCIQYEKGEAVKNAAAGETNVAMKLIHRRRGGVCSIHHRLQRQM